MFGYVLAGGVRRGAASYVEVWLGLAGMARCGAIGSVMAMLGAVR
jgi:hypothetical protein